MGLAQAHSSDTPGPKYQSITQCYFHKAHGVLLLYISSPSSFLSIHQWIENIKVAGRVQQAPSPHRKGQELWGQAVPCSRQS